MSKKQSNIILGIIFLVVSAFALFFSSDGSTGVSFGEIAVSPSPDVYTKEVVGASIFPTSSPTSQVTQPTIIVNNSGDLNQASYRVVKVVDGDTLDVVINGKTERLRLIGIDTPETVDPRKSVQCFGKEASNKAKELLIGQYVTLEADPTQGDRDKYKRLLRYVFLTDGTNYNLFMIKEGYAHEYTYDSKYKYQLAFRQAETLAQENQRGLWSPDTCSGNK